MSYSYRVYLCVLLLGSKLANTPACGCLLPVRAKDTINQLKEEISNLSKLVEKGAGLSVGQENMVKELIRVRDELTRKNDEQGQTIAVSVRVQPILSVPRYQY